VDEATRGIVPGNVASSPKAQAAAASDDAAKARSVAAEVGQEVGASAKQPTSADKPKTTPLLLSAKTAGPALGQEVTARAATAAPAARQRFRQATSFDQSGLGYAKSPPVLASFELEQNDDRIRIVDADGSVYAGQLVLGAEEWQRKDSDARAQPKDIAELKSVELLKKESDEYAGRQRGLEADSKSIAFRASGTNRTLNQLVVIDAKLVTPVQQDDRSAGSATAVSALALEPTSAPARAETRAQRTVIPPGSASSANKSLTRGKRTTLLPTPVATNLVLKLQGKAKIGATDELIINAIGVGP
jgi:hypothetical protein